MGYSNGQLEPSLGIGKGEKGDSGLPGIGFNLTDDGDFNINTKRLTDVGYSVDDQYATTKMYVDSENSKQDIATNNKAEKSEVLLLDGSQSMTDNLNMKNNKIINLQAGAARS